ncbi:MMPL family transporter [Arthrobacter sp. CAN_C5]|uniref:MMPL family transporter n=1 Tax=Arthrobacter sp. CAN_C5 TaxID=2760706 RepID=UPI001AE7738D|nr:MMPL family transporter [Arthrobacter sp. CAN_C5]MBP2216979.1 RND superfamily putative drug exporter [Arthrobacter sp. CAN_C5]
MSGLLYRVGAFCFHRRWLTVSAWVATIVIVFASVATFGGPLNDSTGIPGTQSQELLDKLEDKIPAPKEKSGRMVVAAPAGEQISPAQFAVLAGELDRISALDQVKDASDPAVTGAVSPDRRIAVVEVVYEAGGSPADTTRAAIMAAADPLADAGLEAQFSPGISGSPSAIGSSEIVGIVIAAIVLVAALGSLIAAGLPLLTALFGVAVGLGTVFAFTQVFSISQNAVILALMLGLAVGIDYCLFIVNRHRNQMLRGMPAAQSAALSVGTSGNAVLFAGLTVVIALAALTLPGIPFLSVMGLSAAGAVAVAVLVALTLTPALLSLVGNRIIPRRAREAAGTRTNDAGTSPKRESRWARFVTAHPVSVVISTVLLLGLVSIPALSMRLGLPDESANLPESSSYQAYKLIEDGFGAGTNGPLLVAATIPERIDAEKVVTALTRKLTSTEHVAAAYPAAISDDGTFATVQVIPVDGPSSQSTEHLVQALRADAADYERDSGATDVGVTGQTAMNIDVSAKLANALPLYLAVVIGLSLVLLLLVFRSILVPLKATAGFLLSLTASLGAVVAVFQWGWFSELFGTGDPAPIMAFLPIILIGVLFGLAMDYQMFLVSGMRESYVQRGDARRAVRAGYSHGARVVTAAAIIMIAVFGGFVFSEVPDIRAIGFALGFGVFVDAFLVRMTLVPALMQIFGRAAWWCPAWLARILPDVDVEGSRLTRHPADGVREAPEPERQLVKV